MKFEKCVAGMLWGQDGRPSEEPPSVPTAVDEAEQRRADARAGAEVG